MSDVKLRTAQELIKELLNYPRDCPIQFVIKNDRNTSGISTVYYNSCPDILVLGMKSDAKS